MRYRRPTVRVALHTKISTSVIYATEVLENECVALGERRDGGRHGS